MCARFIGTLWDCNKGQTMDNRFPTDKDFEELIPLLDDEAKDELLTFIFELLKQPKYHGVYQLPVVLVQPSDERQ